MLSMRVPIRLALILTTGGLLCLSVLSLAQELRAQEQQARSLPLGLPPPRSEQVTSVPVIITYQDGELTVEAQNATLSDVLRAVCSQTGAVTDISPGGGDEPERVFGRWGPGPARDVVASLLHDTHFNYVMQGSSDDPDGLAQIILFPKLPDPAAGKDSAHRTQPTTPGRTDSIQQRVLKQQETGRPIQANAGAARLAPGGGGRAKNDTIVDSTAMGNLGDESSPPQRLAEITALLAKQTAASEIPVDSSTTGPGTSADQSAAGPGNSGDNQGAGQMPTVPRRRRHH
jgi:hypothetical protein